MARRLASLVTPPTVVEVQYKIASAVHKAASYIFDDDDDDEEGHGHNEPALPESYIPLDDSLDDGALLCRTSELYADPFFVHQSYPPMCP
jgi:hypothetical protein